jgi:hypothetical protein
MARASHWQPSERNRHAAVVELADPPSSPTPRKAKRAKKKGAKHTESVTRDAVPVAAHPVALAPRFASRVMRQTFGELPPQWPILLLRQGLLLLVDGIDARYGLGQSPNGKAARRP